MPKRNEPWSTWLTPAALRGVRVEMGRDDLPETWAEQLPRYVEFTRASEIVRQHLRKVQGGNWRFLK